MYISLLGPILLLVFVTVNGARLIAGQEEDGTLELELTVPVFRRRLLVERLVALWVGVTFLVAALTAVAIVLVAALDPDVRPDRLLAGCTGPLLLVLGFGTLTLGGGAATGRRSIALGLAGGLAVTSFALNAIGPTIDAGWMTAVSPFGWYLESDPLVEGFDLGRLALLAVPPVAAAGIALTVFDRPDLAV
jgi:ABC-2 type transport system permease protein